MIDNCGIHCCAGFPSTSLTKRQKALSIVSLTAGTSSSAILPSDPFILLVVVFEAYLAPPSPASALLLNSALINS